MEIPEKPADLDQILAGLSHQLAEAVIREALNQGYAIVTVGEMLGGGKKWNREFAVDSTSAP